MGSSTEKISATSPASRYWILLLVCLMLGIVSAIYYANVRNAMRETESSLLKQEENLCEVLANNAARRLRNRGSNLTMLRKLNSTQAYINDPSVENRKILEYDFLEFSNSSRMFDQIRLLGLDGQEIIRINYAEGSAYIVPSDKLQNKKDRYYFQNTLKLDRYGMYISLLDLNVENNGIETPLKPVIRYGACLYNNEGKRVGVLLLNFLAQEVLNDFTYISPDRSEQVYMVNEKGYWLYGENPESEWGFMYPERKQMTFQQKYPEEWNKITHLQDGAIRTKNGIFSFRFVNILTSTVVPSSIAFSKTDEKGWYVITHINADMLENYLSHVRQTSMITFSFILGAILITTLLLLRHQNTLKKRETSNLMDRSAKEWRETFDAFEDMIAIVGQDRTIKRGNQAFLEHFPKALGKPCSKAFRSFGNMPDICNTCEIFTKSVIRKREIHTVNGEDKWYDFVSTPIYNDANEVVEVVHSFRDITRQKNNERAIAESTNLLKRSQKIAKLGNWFLNFSTGELKWSDEVYEIYEVQKGEYIPSYSCLPDLVHKEDLQQFNEEWDKAINGNAPFDTTHRILTRNNVEKIVHEQAEITYDDAGKPLTAEGIVQDITERQLLEAQLHQSEKLQTIGELAGGVAHDFNNQLTAIMGYGELLASKACDEKTEKFASNIVTASKRAADLTRQLLAYSRKSQKRSLPVKIHTLIDETISVLERSIDKRITLHKYFKAKTDIITGDPSLLQNALLNLGINSRDAMPEGGSISFNTENTHIDAYTTKKIMQELEPGDYIIISVYDSGDGIPKELQSKIFEPFFTTKEEGKGTGMGLAAVYGTIKQHGGTIRVYSEVGHGAKFNIYLPLSPDAKLEGSPLEGISEEHGTGTIMVVDDEILVREIACDILEELDYSVITVDDPRKVVEIYQKRRDEIDMIIMDIIMPGLNGRELFTQLMKINPEVKILVASGFSINNDVQQMLDSGALEFISKPFIPAELSRAVSRVMQHKP